MTLIAGDTPALDVAGLSELKGEIETLSVAPDDAGADGVAAGALVGSVAFGKGLGADWVCVGCCVVDGVGCPKLIPDAGVTPGWPDSDRAGGWLGSDATP